MTGIAPKFSANLGFLWAELSLPDAIRAAAAAGFDAVECHWPYESDPADVKFALDETGLQMLGLNTIRGEEGQNGLSALPDRVEDARMAIDQALSYAAKIAASNVHVMAGIASGGKAHDTFIANLDYACRKAADQNINILIEPLNSRDAPGYFLTTAEQAAFIINQVNQPNLKLMFDCYHLQIMGGDISRKLKMYLDIIGHVQIAGVPARNEPDQGELNYKHIYNVLAALEYENPIGAEYRPTTDTLSSLGWLKEARSN